MIRILAVVTTLLAVLAAAGAAEAAARTGNFTITFQGSTHYGP